MSLLTGGAKFREQFFGPFGGAVYQVEQECDRNRKRPSTFVTAAGRLGYADGRPELGLTQLALLAPIQQLLGAWGLGFVSLWHG